METGDLENKEASISSLYLRRGIQMFSCSAGLNIVHGVILRSFYWRLGVPVVRLDVPVWRQRFWKSPATFIFCCRRTFSQVKAECVLMSKEPLSVFQRSSPRLFSGTGNKSFQTHSNTHSNPPCRPTARRRLWAPVCGFRGSVQSIQEVPFQFNTKWKAAYQLAQLGLTHGRGRRARSDKGLTPAPTWSPPATYRVDFT